MHSVESETVYSFYMGYVSRFQILIYVTAPCIRWYRMPDRLLFSTAICVTLVTWSISVSLLLLICYIFLYILEKQKWASETLVALWAWFLINDGEVNWKIFLNIVRLSFMLMLGVCHLWFFGFLFFFASSS